MPTLAAIFLSLLLIVANSVAQTHLPYAKADISERQAATHLLERFAFGPRPGEIDQVVGMGVDVWFEKQMSGNLSGSELDTRLSPFQSLGMSAREIVDTYPRYGIVRSQAYREGAIVRNDSTMDKSELRKKIRAFAKEKGYRPHSKLTNELLAQKLIRAVYSENQLVEVLTDFWFNHFNVSIKDNQARAWVMSYERDAIRPHVLGRFRELLGATAKHPAMLFYLDNAQSTAPNKSLSKNAKRRTRIRRQAKENRGQMEMAAPSPKKRSKRGINENYARELLELHTLGVEGGYTQKDVVEVARAFTGWTVYQERFRKQMNRKPRAFVREGEFLFRAGAHDAEEKFILGRKFPAGGCIGEGERVLDIVAQHPSTARHLSYKLAVRFVSDNPPESLVERLTQTFLKTDGDIRTLIHTIAYSPEFWEAAKQRTKTKTPFELAVSALRALKADVKNPRSTLQWIARMGQPLYACQPPTGYPDYAEAWINAGTLLNRMNFGMSLASGRIRGVVVNLPAVKQRPQSESVNTVLEICATLLMPERDLSETLGQLAPIIQTQPTNTFKRKVSKKQKDNAVAQMVGVVLGSPEFQRH